MKNIKYLFMVLIFILFGCINKNVYVKSLNSNSYYFSEEWYGISGDEIIMTGKTRINLIITYFDNINDFIEIKIMKDMTDFSHLIMVETIAKNVLDRYEFEFIDGWGNKAFGYIIFNNNDTITFYLDCIEYSENGIMMARLYGSTYILNKGEIVFD